MNEQKINIISILGIAFPGLILFRQRGNPIVCIGIIKLTEYGLKIVSGGLLIGDCSTLDDLRR